MRWHTRARLAIIIVLPLFLVAIAVFLARTYDRPRSDLPVHLDPLRADHAHSQECQGFMSALPTQMGTFLRVDLAQPAPEATAAFRNEQGNLLEIRCGIERPPELQRDAAFQEVSGVKWLRVNEHDLHPEQSWVAVDRSVYIFLRYDPAVGNTAPVQDMSLLIGHLMSATTPRYP